MGSRNPCPQRKQFSVCRSQGAHRLTRPLTSALTRAYVFDAFVPHEEAPVAHGKLTQASARWASADTGSSLACRSRLDALHVFGGAAQPALRSQTGCSRAALVSAALCSSSLLCRATTIRVQ